MTVPEPSFEERLKQIDAIIKELSSDQTSLDKGVLLFKQGRALITACEASLRDAQAQVDAASGVPGAANASTAASPFDDDTIPF